MNNNMDREIVLEVVINQKLNLKLKTTTNELNRMTSDDQYCINYFQTAVDQNEIVGLDPDEVISSICFGEPEDYFEAVASPEVMEQQNRNDPDDVISSICSEQPEHFIEAVASPEVMEEQHRNEPEEEKDFVSPLGPSNKLKPKTFSTIETFCLLKIYMDNAELFKKHHKKQYVVWDKISEEMEQNKYNRSRDTCLNRFTNLKKKYTELKRGMRSGDAKPDWPYFEEFEKILGEKPMMKPHTQLDSLSGQSVSSLLKKRKPEAHVEMSDNDENADVSNLELEQSSPLNSPSPTPSGSNAGPSKKRKPNPKDKEEDKMVKIFEEMRDNEKEFRDKQLANEEQQLKNDQMYLNLFEKLIEKM